MEEKSLNIRVLRDSDIPAIAEHHYKTMMVEHEEQNSIVAPTLDKKESKVITIPRARHDNRPDKTYKVSDHLLWGANTVLANEKIIEEWQLAIQQGEYVLGQAIVFETLLTLHGISIEYDDKSMAYKQLCFAVMNAHIRALHDINKRIRQGWHTVPYHAGTVGSLSERLQLISSVTPANDLAEQSTNTVTLGQLIEEYNNDPINKRKRDDLIKRNKGFQKVLLELLGDDFPLNKLDRKVAKATFEQVAMLPKNFNKKRIK